MRVDVHGFGAGITPEGKASVALIELLVLGKGQGGAADV
jgi:hypothetical protein